MYIALRPLGSASAFRHGRDRLLFILIFVQLQVNRQSFYLVVVRAAALQEVRRCRLIGNEVFSAIVDGDVARELSLS